MNSQEPKQSAETEQLPRGNDSDLTRLLAEATTGGEDFGPDHEDVLVTIGKGMFWSQDWDEAARELAKEIHAELSRFAIIPE